MAKCAASTSSTLGVRLGGMQLFNEMLNEFKFLDKYYGRSLDENEFVKELLKFFNNGLRLRRCVIDQVICKLRELRASIEKQTCFRFFSTSLLIAYEGCTNKDCKLCEQQLTFRTPSALNSCFLINECMKDDRVRKKSSTTNRLVANSASNNLMNSPMNDETANHKQPNNEELDEGLVNDQPEDKLSDESELDEDDSSSMDVDDYYQAIERANKVSNEEFMKNCNANQLMVTTTIKTNKKRKRRKNSFSCDEDSSMDSNADCTTNFTDCNYDEQNNNRLLGDQNSCSPVINNNKLIGTPVYLATQHSSESSESCSSNSDLSEHQQVKPNQLNKSGSCNSLVNKNKALARKKNLINPKKLAKTSYKQKLNESSNQNKADLSIKKAPTKKSAKPNVDVRIIDFAHTILKEDDKDHHGPDQGFLFGLDNLIKLLVNAKDNNYEESRL